MAIDHAAKGHGANDRSANAVAVTRRIDAPAVRIFSLLCEPESHVAIDGSGMLRSATADRVARVGDSFAVEMWNEGMGEYEMTNAVVEFTPDRVIRWEPTMTRASRAEDHDGLGESAKQRWGFELTPVSDSVTDVTETFDCIESPDWLKEAVKGGELWVDAMNTTLDKLAERVAG
jgi:uncharacterized protein YndB with AHSA1/START domain